MVAVIDSNRDVFFYVGNEDCVWYYNTYYLYEQNWTLLDRTYYYPNNYIVAALTPANAVGGWSAYPNPASDWLWLNAPMGSPYRVYDLQGKMQYNGVAKGSERLSLPGLHGAILLLVGEGKAATSRLIKIGE